MPPVNFYFNLIFFIVLSFFSFSYFLNFSLPVFFIYLCLSLCAKKLLLLFTEKENPHLIQKLTCLFVSLSSSSLLTSQTTLLGCVFDGGVILCADSRTTMGTYVSNRMSNKIAPITEKIFSCHAGSAADTQFVEDQTAYIVASQWYV